MTTAGQKYPWARAGVVEAFCSTNAKPRPWSGRQPMFSQKNTHNRWLLSGGCPAGFT